MTFCPMAKNRLAKPAINLAVVTSEVVGMLCPREHTTQLSRVIDY